VKDDTKSGDSHPSQFFVGSLEELGETRDSAEHDDL
jgi:hypothetical protein